MEIQKSFDREEWDNYILDNGGHPLQLWGWGVVKAAHGWNAERFALYDDTDKILAAAQVLTRKLPYPLKAFSYIPRGPVGETDETKNVLLEQLATYVKKNNKSVALSVEPDSIDFTAPKGWHTAANSVLPAATIALDLTLPESQLLADMAKKTRQYIRKSAAEAGEIRQIRDKEGLAAVLDIYHHTAKRAGFRLHDDHYYADVFNNMADNCIIYATYKDNAPIAFLWLALSESTAFELYGGVTPEGQDLRANYALKWHAIRKAKEWGLKTYDFGGLISGGVSNFKQGWANKETHLAGTYDKPLSSFYGLWSKGLPAGKNIVRKLKC